jgi:hypothetical protein
LYHSPQELEPESLLDDELESLLDDELESLLDDESAHAVSGAAKTGTRVRCVSPVSGFVAREVTAV